MKEKSTIYKSIFGIYFLCYLTRIIEYFFIRTDQTVIGEAFIHKVFGIVLIVVCMKKYGYKFADIGIKKEGCIRYAIYGLLLGLSMFFIGYLSEILLLKQQGKFISLDFYVSSYAVDHNIVLASGWIFLILCILGNIINVMMEEGLFRGLFPRMLLGRPFVRTALFCSVLFAFWHIIGPVRNYLDGLCSFNGMAANVLMLLISSGLIAFKFAMLAKIEGALYMGMADHFVNNAIVNLLHVTGTTGTDEMMFLRITVAQCISFVIVLVIFLKKRKQD